MFELQGAKLFKWGYIKNWIYFKQGWHEELDSKDTPVFIDINGQRFTEPPQDVELRRLVYYLM